MGHLNQLMVLLLHVKLWVVHYQEEVR